MEPYDLAIIGGGVIGLSIALEAANHGWRVVVLESGQLGREASWAGAGILPAGAKVEAHDPIEQLRSLSAELHAIWARQLLEWTGIDTEYRNCGGLYVATTLAEKATLAANRFWWEEHGIAYEAWSHSQARARVQGIDRLIERFPTCELWFVPDDCRLRNPRHISALIAACRARGVRLLENARVEELITVGTRIEAARLRVQADGQGTEHVDVRAERYCICNGAWAVELLDSLGIPTGILPVRGQMVLYRSPRPLFSMVINEGHRYLVPRDDGHVLAGSCEEEVGFDRSTTPEMIAELQAWAQGLWPELADVPVVDQWAGLRPGSFDSFPYLGAIPAYYNAYIASGHFRHGLHWSTATAVLMVEVMSGRKPRIDLNPFRLQRGHAIGKPTPSV